jgi:hypothetical protein
VFKYPKQQTEKGKEPNPTFCVNVSDAAVKIATSLTPALTAFSNCPMVGVSTGYLGHPCYVMLCDAV